MSWTNSEQSYGRVTIAVHWLSAMIVFGMFGLGLWMSDLELLDPWFHAAPLLHKRLGIILLVITLLRIIWRFSQPTPLPPPHSPMWERWVAATMQGVLYLLLLLLPVAGYLLVTAKGQPLNVDWGFAIPALPWHIVGQKAMARDLHELLAWGIVSLVALHAAAALKHHFIDRDDTLRRMLGMAPRHS